MGLGTGQIEDRLRLSGFILGPYGKFGRKRLKPRPIAPLHRPRQGGSGRCAQWL